MIFDRDSGQSYIVDSKLGSGSNGEVFRVQRTNDTSSKEMALKVFRKDIVDEAVEKARDGYEVYVKNCENKCGSALHRIFSVGDFFVKSKNGDEKFQGVLQDLADEDSERLGQFMTARLLTHPYETLQALAYAYNELGVGLAQLHERKLVLNDIKPQNIFLVQNDLRFGDFDGVSVAGSSTSPFMTLAYSGFEMMLPNFPQNTRSDYFGFGGVFLTWILGNYPLQVYLTQFKKSHGEIDLIYQDDKYQEYDEFKSKLLELFTRSRDAGPVKLWNAYPVALDEDGDVRFLETPPKMLSLTWSQAMRNAFSEKKSEILKISG